MAIYKRILGFLKPFVQIFIFSMLLTFMYVLLNNISLWVSVDFVRELFSDAPGKSADSPSHPLLKITEVIGKETQNAPADSSLVVHKSAKDKLDKVSYFNYKKFKKTVQGFLRRDTKRDTLRVICIVIFFSFLFKNLFDYLRRVINRYIEIKIVNNLRNQLQAAVVKLPLKYFSDTHTGKMTSIVFNDVKAVRQVLDSSLGNMILTPIQLFLNICILFWISWKLSLITLIIIPISATLIYKIGQSMRRKSRRTLKQISEVTALFQEAVSSIQVVKAYTAEAYEILRFRKANLRFLKTQFRAVKLGQATSPFNEITAICVLIVLLWYGGNLVYAGEFDADDFVKFLLFLFTCLDPLREFSRLNNIFQQGVAAAERIFDLMDTAPEDYAKSGDVEMPPFSKTIQFNHVSFKYNDDAPYVLKDIDLIIEKGKTVAFVGHSGSGKTTLVNLIPRFYNVVEGQIAIDGTDTQNLQLTSLRSQIGIVTQDTFLFNDTIRFNISYGMENVSEEDIIHAAKAANAWEFIEQMEDGLDSMVGEKGIKLSGGQKQRLSISRAILKNPPILILDEATSALDTKSERLVQDAIDQLMKNRTVLVIAHRLSTVIHADKIVVMNHGDIVGSGAHAELLETCPIYSNLYNIQFDQKTGSA